MTTEKLNESELQAILATHPPENYDAAPDALLLSYLASIDRQAREKLMTETRYQAGEIICREGEDGDTAFLIWSGRALILKGDLQSPTVLGYRGPGETIGEMALLEKRPRSASIVAAELLHLLKISHDDFQELLKSAPQIAVGMMKLLSARLRASDVGLIASTAAEKKLARQVSDLELEKQVLLELQQLKQETTDLIVNDLHNPLQAMQGVFNMLEMMLPEEVLATNRDLLTIAYSSQRRMQRLVDSLLKVAQQESGGEVPHSQL
ncbi:MAG: cyclic nucleotide-binding domain-containing protein [Anaerolineales bacterium]|nr:cyclic nucleotide-binding domain-containing protein [Anaerolineales bacterium]